MNVTLKVWRQKNASTPGKLIQYKLANLDPDMSFLEMFDVLNGELTHKGEEPVTFDHDCREGICGACSMYVNGPSAWWPRWMRRASEPVHLPRPVRSSVRPLCRWKSSPG